MKQIKKTSYIYYKGLAVCLSVCLILTGCSIPLKTKKPAYTPKASVESSQEPIGMSKEDASYAALDYLKNMSLKEKVGQLFVVNLELLDDTRGGFYEWKKITKQMKENLEKYHVGGVILFSRNIQKRKQTKKLIRRLQKNAGIPLFVTVDEEGGDVARIGNNEKMKTTTFPTMEEIGQQKDADYVYDMGVTIGQEIGELGFNVDFAPVADVKTSELNKEIGTRSFGDDPAKVSGMVDAFVKGIQSQNVCATLKHFPGQGSSNGDTHQGSVDIDSSISSLRKIDFKPFEAGIEAGADFIMVSHISVSKVTESSEPASMSDLIMTTILRDELRFDGLIVTDAFDMASITDNYTPGEAACGSFKAGADIIVMPQDLDEAYQSVMESIQDGVISEKRLDDSVLRILRLKFQRGIMDLEDLANAKDTTSASDSEPSTASAVTATPKGRKHSAKKS